MSKTNLTFLKRRIGILLIIFIAGLVLSGVTAFPLEAELKLAQAVLSSSFPETELHVWTEDVYKGVRDTNARYPFVAYGTDWLGFAHLIIAVAFIGPLRDPLKNVWVIEFGIIACLAIFPFAFIAGAAREIPIFWRLLDCMFGVAGGVLLIACYCDIMKLKNLTTT